jgi:hypothetical protein
MGGNNKMTPLQNQQQFETMLRPRRPTEEGFDGTYAPWAAICFSAAWCGPCRRLDKDTMVSMTPQIQWFSCDIDENLGTAEYCDVRSIPGFVLLKDGVFQGRKLGAGSVGEVLQWLAEKGAPVNQQS